MYKVFIVDDEAAIIKNLCTAVDWESYNFEIAGTFTDPQQALEKLSSEKIDLLVTDVCMPVIDGLTLMKKARAYNPALKVIVVSAYDTFDYVKTALRNGAENYLLKPLNQDELMETLQKTAENIENDSLYSLYENSSMLAFKNNILERWVRNAISESELSERADLIGINLEAPCFTVMIFQNAALPLDIDSASRLMHILKRNLTIPGIHFFINSAFMAVGILTGDQPLSGDFLNPYLDRAAFNARKEKIDLFMVIGPTVCKVEDVYKSYNLARMYASVLHFGCRRLYCSDFPDNSPTLSSLWDILAKYPVHMNEMQPAEFENMLRISLENALKTDDAEARRKIAFSAAVRIYDIVQSNRQGKKPHEIFVEHFSKFLSIPDNEIKKWISDLITLAMGILNDNQRLLHPYVRKTIEYICSESNNDISLKTIAAEFNVSPAYLGQLFKSQTGKYFNDFLTSVRLEYCKRLIIETDMKVSDIAAQAGFSSQTYFNRIFKRVHGTSPREYRYIARTGNPS
ncbi:MAG TPA: response regulator [Clostridia bacterium]